MAHTEAASTMEDMWQNARVRFRERTGLALDLKPPATLDTCIDKIKNASDPASSLSPEKESSTAKAKEYGISILRCLKLLGGVASQVASGVFAPSTLCFNAMSILLDIPQKMHSFHQSLDGLFEELEPSLSMFQIYERIEQFNEIEPELKQAIHRIMISFIDICALSVRLRNSGRWQSFKVAAKLVILDKDSGVKDEVERFKKLTSSHTKVQATQTLKGVLDGNSKLRDILNEASETGRKIDNVASDVAILRDSNEKREVKEAKQRELKNIQAKMGLDQIVLKSSDDICAKLRKLTVPGTANWLENPDEHPDFEAWAEKGNIAAMPLFLLTGDQNTGKSVVVSAVVHHLRMKDDPATDLATRTLVAAYFFPSQTGKKDDDNLPLETALKCIAFQLAEQDPVYRRSLSQKCDKDPDMEKSLGNATCQQLWEILGIGSPKGKTVHYIVIDGLAGLPKEFDKKWAQLFDILATLGPDQTDLRVLLSLRPSMVSSQMSQVASNVDIEKYNSADIRRYITHQLESKDLFQDSDEDSKKRRTNLENILTTKVRGNFIKVDTVIDQINSVVDSNGSESEVDRILDESNDEMAISRTAISQLEERLNAEEVKELNELLRWVLFSYWELGVNELNAALFLQFRTQSMLRLRKKIEGKYAGVLYIHRRATVDFVDVVDGMSELLKKEGRQTSAQDDTTKFTVTVQINKGDLTSVQSFLWSLAQKASQEDFGFQTFIEKDRLRGSIQVNEFDAHLAIVKSAFRLLGQGPDKRTESLGPYVLSCLPQHLEALEKATGTDALTPQERAAIGDGLFAIFESEEVIQRHWEICGSLIWYREAGEVAIFRRWLQDPAVVSNLGRLDRRWLKKIEADPNPNRALLEEIMKMVARRWLTNTEWHVSRLFEWLRGYLAMPASEKDEHTETVSDTDGKKDPVIEEKLTVDQVANWCKEVLGIAKEDSVWYQRLGETFKDQHQYEMAIQSFEKGIEQDSSNAKCFQGLARTLAASGKFSAACKAMEQALDLFREEEPPDIAILEETYLYLSGWYINLGEFTQAIDYTNEALRITHDGTEAFFRLLFIYLQADLKDDAIGLLNKLFLVPDDKDPSTCLGQLVTRLLDDLSEYLLLKCFSLLRDQTMAFDTLLREIDLAITTAQKDGVNERHQMALHLFNGIARYYFTGESTMSRQLALASWQRCIDLGKESGWGTSDHDKRAADFISAHHFNHAITAVDAIHLQSHVKQMEAVVSRAGPFTMSMAKAYLASYYSITKNRTAAKRVLQGCADLALEMLSDNIDENDVHGYFNLGSVLIHCGDELNALSAFSLVRTRPQNGNVMSWLLETEKEPAQTLSLDLIVDMEKQNIKDLKEQIEYVLKKVKEHLPTATTADLQHLDTLSSILETQDDTATQSTQPDPSLRDSDHSDQSAQKPENHEITVAYQEIHSTLTYWSNTMKGGRLDYLCDGCSLQWGFERAMNLCKYCYNIGFCDECLAQLKQDKLAVSQITALMCNPTHAWLRLPRWERKNFMETLEGKVMMGGQIEDGKQIGGELVTASTWLEALKSDWGFDKTNVVG